MSKLSSNQITANTEIFKERVKELSQQKELEIASIEKKYSKQISEISTIITLKIECEELVQKLKDSGKPNSFIEEILFPIELPNTPMKPPLIPLISRKSSKPSKQRLITLNQSSSVVTKPKNMIKKKRVDLNIETEPVSLKIGSKNTYKKTSAKNDGKVSKTSRNQASKEYNLKALKFSKTPKDSKKKINLLGGNTTRARQIISTGEVWDN